jgi:predicted transcriptional regulator
MEVRLTPDEEARLAAIAAVLGSDPEQLIKDAALSLLDEDRRFREAVRTGIAQADRGELIEEAEMDARVERMFQS